MRRSSAAFAKKHTSPRKYVLLLTVVIFIMVMFASFYVIDQKIRPVMMSIAEHKTVEFATRTINEAVKSTDNISFDDLIEINLDQNGQVTTLGWRPEATNKALRSATERAEYYLYGMNLGEELTSDDPDAPEFDFGEGTKSLPDRDTTVIEIPLGQVTGNTIFANLGPKIPVHMEVSGSVMTDIVHEIKEFGVNAALIEIFIPVTVNLQIIVPFSTTNTEVSTRVLVDSRVIMGSVPDFYNAGGNDGGPTISVPARPYQEND